MSTADTPPNKPRRSQEDRTSEARQRIIDATIRCLYRVGYSAVTTAMIAKEAGLSRGNIFYHFSSTADLMVAVRDAVYLEERQAVEAIRARLGTRQYLAELPRFVLEGMRKAPAIAVDEILLAARSDAELSAKLRRSEQLIDARALAELEEHYALAGLKPPPDLPILMRLAVAAYRGLAIAELVQGPEAQIEECIDYLIRLMKIAETMEPKAAASSG
ncbi:TetR/AcrR family transcriptional regulator [Novosphingobium sp.]|uniref:TetR/AcrR family transcriptional regulator n=1 Tax=Novosphingobium sp. TaxID=1874826 RepID=UPI002629A285|nr:TetR/AcrR family transcriptional regulator [Novosphingobium sp.]